MQSYNYSNNYSARNFPSFLTEDGELKEEFISKIKEKEQKLENEIKCVVPRFLPTGNLTIYTGYNGIALFFFLKYRKTNDKIYLENALKLADDAVMNSMRCKRRWVSFLNGTAGTLALASVLHKLNGDIDKSNELIERLLKIDCADSSVADEILYGRAGYLYCLLFVDKYCGRVIPENYFRSIIYLIIKSGWKKHKIHQCKQILYFEWHDKNYLGAAHGTAGVLHALLCANNMLSEDERDVIILNTLKWLVEQKYTSGNFLSSEGSNKDRLVQWCHGAPGFVHLFLRAYQVYGQSWMLDAAKDAGNVVWERGLTSKGYSICHGVAGNAYSFLALYKATKEQVYLFRAACFANWILQYPRHEGMAPDNPHSLFEGMTGVAYYLNDFLDPENSAFPGYDL